MTDLDQRIAALREAVGKMTPEAWEHFDDSASTKRQEIIALGVTVARCYAGNPNGVNDAAGIVALRNNALAIIDKQQREIASKDAEIERLRARVAELEKPPTEQERWMNVSPLRDAGPTELRGRITRRTT